MKILILTAFLAEATSLVECIENVEPLTLAKHSCLYSVYHNNELYIANTGISAVAAANTTTALCNALHPDLIFICGRAVGLISGQCLGDLIVGETIFDMDHHDLPDIGDETPFAKWLLDPHSQEPLPYTFNIPAKLVNICLQTKLPNVRKGIIASSNISPAPANKMEQLKKLQCDAIEMESAAVCQAA